MHVCLNQDGNTEKQKGRFTRLRVGLRSRGMHHASWGMVCCKGVLYRSTKPRIQEQGSSAPECTCSIKIKLITACICRRRVSRTLVHHMARINTWRPTKGGGEREMAAMHSRHQDVQTSQLCDSCCVLRSSSSRAVQSSLSHARD
jgi:hypothetical protein